MANINITEATDYLVSGTTGDDTITLGRALDTDASGPSAIDAFDGNGGSDTLSLEQDQLASFIGTNGLLTYDAATDNGTWTLDVANATDTTTSDIIAKNGIGSIAFADGITLVAGTAASGQITAAGVSGSSFDLDDVIAYDWTGTALSGGSVTAGATTVSIVSVAGIDVSAGGSFVTADGTISVNQTSKTVDFTPTTTALAAANANVGDTVSFTYDIVVSIDGTETTHTVSYDTVVGFTAGSDTWNAADDDNGQVADASGTGNDTFNGDDRDNSVQAGAGDDTIYGGNGDDSVSGGLQGGDGDDFIRGGNGDDIISVGTSDSTDMNNLGGGAGNDDITGGSGNDVIFGGQGNDSNLNGGAGNDVVNGGAGNDTLIGGAGDDTLKGGDGDDRLEGTSGSNELRGGAGTDTVVGGTGNDMIYSSLGGDELTGDDGDDVFVLKAGTGNTTITDFNASTQNGIDKLNVSELGYTGLSDVLAVAYEIDTNGDAAGGEAVVIAIDADTSVTLTGVALGDLAASNFDFAS